MTGFFDVTKKDLKDLEPEPAVDFFRKILYAEARSIKLGSGKVHVPGSINAPDGGIDAVVDNTGGDQDSEIIHSGVNYYQIKTGQMSPNALSTVQKILFKPDKTTLHPMVESCFEEEGFFAVVLFGNDTPPKNRNAAQIFKDELKRKHPEYVNPRIEVWQRSQIIGFLQKFLALRKDLTKTEELQCCTHEEWHDQYGDMQTEFIAGDAQKRFISQMRENLGPDSHESDIRIVGSPGSGKTRIAYEITNTDELAAHVLYFENPDYVKQHNFLGRILGSGDHAILIVDECDKDAREYLWNRIATSSSRLKLITIDNERGGNRVHELPPLGKAEITRIISSYVPEEVSAQYAPWCSPSPRLANWLGKNLRADPNFSALSEDEFYARFIAGRLRRGSQEFRDRKTVLMWISLFIKVGHAAPYDKESKALAKKIEQKSGISEGCFFEIVSELRQEKILQGHMTLYISPDLVHFWLWCTWWDTYGAGFALDEFMFVDGSTTPPTYFPQSMEKGFFDMFAYARESSNAMEVVRRFLMVGGLLDDGELLETHLGARLFSALARAEPKMSLDLLDRTVGKWDRKRLLGFTVGRREVMWRLEDLVRKPSNFDMAAKILLRLAVAENEGAANNATGVFAELFSVAPRELSRTQASVEVKLSLLKKTLDSSDKQERMCALKACNMALESLHFTRMDYGRERFLFAGPENWEPGQTEIHTYQTVIKLIASGLQQMEDDERQEAVRIIITRARVLTRLAPLAGLLTDTIWEISQKPYANLEKIISEIESIIHFDRERLDPAIMSMWKELSRKLQKSDYSSMLKRYVGMSIFTDDLEENRKRGERASERIKGIAAESIQSKEKLLVELEWICRTNTKNVAAFGYELGQMDTNFSLLPGILRVQATAAPSRSSTFLGNYLMALFEKDAKRWELTLDHMAEDPDLCRYVTGVTALSGMTDRAGRRIIRLHKKGAIKKTDFDAFVYRPRLRNLSETVFLKWMRILLDAADSETLNAALALFEWYYIRCNSRALPETIAHRLISHDLLLKESASPKSVMMNKLCWTNIAKKYVKQFPERTIVLADTFLKGMGNKNNIFSGYGSNTLEVLDLICELRSTVVWAVIQKYIGPPLDRRAHAILTWLEGFNSDNQSNSAFTVIPIRQILDWIDADRDGRARHMARFVPKIPFDNEKCIAREFLINYGDNADVRNALHCHFLSGAWTGSGVEHYTQELEKYTEFKKHETNQHVLQWIDDHIGSLKKQIENEMATEERLF